MKPVAKTESISISVTALPTKFASAIAPVVPSVLTASVDSNLQSQLYPSQIGGVESEVMVNKPNKNIMSDWNSALVDLNSLIPINSQYYTPFDHFDNIFFEDIKDKINVECFYVNIYSGNKPLVYPYALLLVDDLLRFFKYEKTISKISNQGTDNLFHSSRLFYHKKGQYEAHRKD